MKILFFANYSLLYGANRSMLTLLKHLKKEGYNIKVMLPHHGEFETELDSNGIDYEVLRVFNQFFYVKFDRKYLLLPFLIIWNILVFPLLLIKVRKFRPDLIYSNTAAECLGILVAKCLHVKHIWHIREFMDRDHKKFFLLGNRARKWYLNQSDGVVFVSKSVADAMLLGDNLNDKHKVIYNGLDLPDVNLLDKHVGELHPNLGMVGLLCEGKGQIFAVRLLPEILKFYPNAQLHIFGDRDSSYKNFVVETAKNLKVHDHVVFHGFVKDQSKIYPSMDLLLMCSQSEGFGRVTIEAMTYGVPVVGYNNAGTSELVKNGKNGYLYNDGKGMIDCIGKILCSDKIFNDIRLYARNDAKKSYSIEKYCSEVDKFLDRILVL